MKTTLNEAHNCPTCGQPLPAGALAGLCPACLMAQGLETDAGSGDANKSRFTPPSLESLAKLFPQLEILGLLGAGGMGAVYKARQPALDRLVALKVLPAGGTEGGNFAERFNREARALARLNHPNIVAVYEFGHVESLHFFLMEYVEGANLRQLEKAGRLAPREALQLIPQICDALQYAHDEGVVHRDIKPENVLVDRKGRVKIADFGLAKILGQNVESLRLTNEGQVMGTPHYMAPEQVARPLAVDHRADIYSLGVVLYEMLTGELPLGKFSPPSRKVQVDVRFDDVVLRALENDPERRYQHASEVKTQVETIAGGAAPATAPASSLLPSGPHKIYWAGIPVVVEQDGQRKVSFSGVLLAIAAAIGLLIASWLFLAFTTDNPYSNFFVPTLAALVIIFAGVSYTLRQPLLSTLPRTPQGTVILPPKRPWWRNGQYYALGSIAVFSVLWNVTVEHTFLFQKMFPRPLPVPAQVMPNKETDTPKPVGSLRLIGGMHTNNLVFARSESIIGFPLHEVVVRFAGPAVTVEQWNWARGFAWGPTVSPNPNERLDAGWQPEPVNSQEIWGGTVNPPTRPSSCWFACPNECQLQFALADETEAAQAVRQIRTTLAQPVSLVPGKRMTLFKVGEREAWLEVRPIKAPAGKLAFLTKHGRPPLNPYSTNQIDSAVIAIPPNADLTITGNGYYTDNKNVFRSTNSIFSTTLNSLPGRPRVYWLTWMAGSRTNLSGDGWEIYLHDAETAKELQHFHSAEMPGTRWSTDWGYESQNANAGETMKINLLKAYEGSSAKGKIHSMVEVEMTMHPLQHQSH